MSKRNVLAGLSGITILSAEYVDGGFSASDEIRLTTVDHGTIVITHDDYDGTLDIEVKQHKEVQDGI